jgi:hypothetical protein
MEFCGTEMNFLAEVKTETQQRFSANRRGNGISFCGISVL